MSGMLINQLRRVSAAGHHGAFTPQGTEFSGLLLSTGAFLYTNGGLKLLVPSRTVTGLYGLAGDPKVMADGQILHSYAFPPDFSTAYYRYYDGQFTSLIARANYTLGDGDYPQQGARYFRHRSDDNHSVVEVNDIRWYVSGAYGRGITVKIQNQDGAGRDQDFVLSNLNYFGGTLGTPDQAFDTYFGNVIGLGSRVLITSRRPDDPDTVKAVTWDGTNIAIVPIDSSIYDLHPLCRDGSDSALCTYSQNQIQNFYEEPVVGSIYDYLGLTFQGDAGGSFRATIKMITSGQQVDDQTGLWVYGGYFEGTEYGIATVDFTGMSARRPTGRAGQSQNWGVQKRPGYTGGSNPQLYKVRNGPFIIAMQEHLPNLDYERFTVTDFDGRTTTVLGGSVVQIVPTILFGNFNGFSGCQPRAGCITSSGPWIMGHKATNDAGGRGAVCGLYGYITHATINNLNSSRPIGAGATVFMDGYHSKDFGASWIIDQLPLGGPGSASAGASSVQHTFRLMPQEIANSILL